MTPIRNAAVAGPLVAAPATAAPVLPNFDVARFAPDTAIDNPHFPVRPGAARTCEGTGADGETERAVQSTVGAGSELPGLRTTSARDRETLDSVLVEDTFDHCARDLDGHMWCFGEDVTDDRHDEAGALVGTDSASAWLAGGNGARPGHIMPAELEVGFDHHQEFAWADDAVDQATIFATGRSVAIGLDAFDAFDDVLRILERVEPEVREFEHHAPGIGQLLVEEDLDEGFANPELRVELIQLAAIPLSAGLPLLAGALAGLAALRRRARRRRVPLVA